MTQIKATNLSIGYNGKVVVKEVNIEVTKGERIAIIGPSGAGKTTLLLALNGTTQVLGGELSVLGINLIRPSKRDLKYLRQRTGIIFQALHLVDRLHVVDNVISGMLYKKPLWRALIKCYTSRTIEEVYEYLRIVGLTDYALQRCDHLSGGQRQRVAIARALAQRPEILLADEPVSSLDPVSAQTVMEILRETNERYEITIIMNLHQLHYAKEYASRIIGMKDGQIVFDGTPREITPDVIQEIYGSELEGYGPGFNNNYVDLSRVVHW
ncbi:MAG: phosphonate ABC transporter ATP-binding protein [Syntrophobacterales bacterium]|nr:phosphonate ABC transporter ATP-binding protein [Syntrophobacterales bacterium]